MNWYKKAQHKLVKCGFHRKWSDEDLEMMRKLYEKGYTSAQIAPLFGVDCSIIIRLNRKYKWRDFQAEKDKKDKLIANLYLLPPDGEGMAAKEIKKQYGFTLLAIKGALKRLNLLENYRGMSDSHKARLADPIKREQWSKNLSKSHKQRYIDNPELARNFGERIKKQWQDPEFRRKMEEIFRSDKNRQRISDYMKKRWVEKYPGGWADFASQFSPEKQREMEIAMWASEGNISPV